jgi:plastocyanin
MRLRVLAVGALLAVGTAVLAATTALGDDGSSGGRQIAMRDDCDPNDPAWGPLGGCTLRRGSVTVAEFNEELASPLADSAVGHQAWVFDPSYLKIKEGQSVRVRNRGGRPHTFTKVAEFGGGFVPDLNVGLDPAPECQPPAGPQGIIPPGGSTRVFGLAQGNHRFMCCIHPWQRALIKVLPRGEDDDD